MDKLFFFILLSIGSLPVYADTLTGATIGPGIGSGIGTIGTMGWPVGTAVGAGSGAIVGGYIGHYLQENPNKPTQFDQWYAAGLRWYEVGDSLVFIFPVNDFYQPSKAGVALKEESVLTELATWLKPIPKTWVRFTGFRRGGDNAWTRDQASQDAQALATYFWDAGIDARGVYTFGFIESGNLFTSRADPDRVEMVVSILPSESTLM